MSLCFPDRIATQASCKGTESLNVCLGDSLPLYSSSLKRHWWSQGVNLCHRPVQSPLSISNSPRDSDRIVECFFVPPVLMFYPPDLFALSIHLLPFPRSTGHCCFSLPATLRNCTERPLINSELILAGRKFEFESCK